MKLAPSGVIFLLVDFAVVIFTSKSTRADFDEEQRSPVVQINSGAVVGKIETLPHGKAVHKYLGIPYAEPPVGELRFAAPRPPNPWSGIKETTSFGSECPQPTLPIPGWNLTKSGHKSEDCLYLNVFVPSTVKPGNKMAVMVWIHGGAFSFGSANIYDSGILASFHDVIVVTFNYRLGILGFFNVPGTEVKGNYGMLDQVLALKWVQANIGSFGGDPNKVTIFGESAGSISVSFHLLSPLSKGLFVRAILQSGSSLIPSLGGKVVQSSQLEWFAKAVNCSLGPDIVKCVHGKTVEDIVEAQDSFYRDRYSGQQDVVSPVVDGEFLPDLSENLLKAGKFHHVDVLIGFTSDEGALYPLMMPPDQIMDGIELEVFEYTVKNRMVYAGRVKSEVIEDLILFYYRNHADPEDKIAIRKAMMDSFSDLMFVAPAIHEAKALAKGGQSPYVYLFNHRVTFTVLPEWAGVCHGTDIPFVFGVPLMNAVDPSLTVLVSNFTYIEKGFSLYIMRMWTDFAKYGSPNPPDSGPTHVTWPTFTEEEQAYLVLDLKPRIERRYKADKVAFWNEIVPKLAELARKREDEKNEEDKAPKDEL